MAEKPMSAPFNHIEQSFEIAAQRCADLTPLVYRRDGEVWHTERLAP